MTSKKSKTSKSQKPASQKPKSQTSKSQKPASQKPKAPSRARGRGRGRKPSIAELDAEVRRKVTAVHKATMACARACVRRQHSRSSSAERKARSRSNSAGSAGSAGSRTSSAGRAGRAKKGRRRSSSGSGKKAGAKASTGFFAKTYLAEVRLGAHPLLTVAKEATEKVNELTSKIATRLAQTAKGIAGDSRVGLEHLQEAVQELFQGDLQTLANSFGTRAYMKWDAAHTTSVRSELGGLAGTIVAQTNRAFKASLGHNLGPAARFYAAGVIDYLATELWAGAGEVTQALGRSRINENHVLKGAKEDMDLYGTLIAMRILQ